VPLSPLTLAARQPAARADKRGLTRHRVAPLPRRCSVAVAQRRLPLTQQPSALLPQRVMRSQESVNIHDANVPANGYSKTDRQLLALRLVCSLTSRFQWLVDPSRH